MKSDICSKCGIRKKAKWCDSYCIECNRIRKAVLYHKNKEKERERTKKFYRENKEIMTEYSKKSKKKYPERVKARNKLQMAVFEGKITRGKCEVCGKENAHAHHDDYSKPLDVRWLCMEHHRQIHMKHKFILNTQHKELEESKHE